MGSLDQCSGVEVVAAALEQHSGCVEAVWTRRWGGVKAKWRLRGGCRQAAWRRSVGAVWGLVNAVSVTCEQPKLQASKEVLSLL